MVMTPKQKSTPHPKMDVVLVSPRIPQNVGNAVRTCAAVGAKLILVRPLGFSLSDKQLKRAGVTYLDQVPIEIWDDWQPLKARANVVLFTSRGRNLDARRPLLEAETLVFGSETDGLSEEIMNFWPDSQLRIPMTSDCRCLNLAVAVAVGVYHFWQWQGFEGCC